MEEILKKIKEWNKEKESVIKSFDQEIANVRSKIYEKNSFVPIFLKEIMLKPKIKMLQRNRTKQMNSMIYHMTNIRDIKSYLETCQNVIFNKEDYVCILKSNLLVKKLENDLQWVKEKEQLDVKDARKVNSVLESFSKEVQPYMRFVYYVSSEVDHLTVNPEYLTNEHLTLISSYQNYGDILRDVLKMPGYNYDTYFFLVEILYTFKNYHFEKERDHELQENPEYLIKRDPLNVILFNNKDLRKIKEKLLQELDKSESLEEIRLNSETLEVISQCILSRRLK